uniref:Uncharacterized protein n=1 Tax=Panagrolaimus sp. JU765 TaxID=591449 RepID=A0AC34QYW5_9BILA
MARKSLMEVIASLANPPAPSLGLGGPDFEAFNAVNALALLQQQLPAFLTGQQVFEGSNSDFYASQQPASQKSSATSSSSGLNSDFYASQQPASQKSSATSSSSGGKKRINRGRTFKVHKGAYNVIVGGNVQSAEYSLELLRIELANKQMAMDNIYVNGESVCDRLRPTVDLLPYLNNPSHCGAIIAGHLFPRDFFVNHILRDTDGNVKAAKGFVNHSNREPLSKDASKLFFDILYYFGGVLIEPSMLESWLWVARKGVNDRGNTSKSGRGVRYFVKPDYVPVLPCDIWHEDELKRDENSMSPISELGTQTLENENEPIQQLMKKESTKQPEIVQLD